MAFSPIALTIPNYRDFKNYWIKAYVPSTTTPKVMASDKTGSPTVAKFELNTEGFPKTSGGALITPYIDGLYDLWLFPTEAEADANDTSSALRLAINVAADAAATDTAAAIDEAFDRTNPGTLLIWQADTSAIVDDVVTYKERSAGNGGGATGDVIAGTGTANGFEIVAHGSLSLSLVIRLTSDIDINTLGGVSDGAFDNSPASNQAVSILSSSGGGVIRYMEGDYYHAAKLTISTTNINLKGLGQIVTKLSTDIDDTFIEHIENNSFTEMTIFQNGTSRNSRGLSTPIAAGQSANSVFDRLLIKGFKYGIWQRTSIWNTFSNLRLECICGIRLSRNAFPDDNTNPNAPGPWNAFSPVGWFHNQINFTNVLCIGGEVGIMAACMGATFSNVTTQLQLTDGASNVVLPSGEVGTGIYIESGTTGSKTNQGSQIDSFYAEGTRRPIFIRDTKFVNVYGWFVQGSGSSGSPFLTPVEVSNSVVFLNGESGQDWFDESVILNNNATVYGKSAGAITGSLDGLIDATSQWLINGTKENFIKNYKFTKGGGSTTTFTIPVTIENRSHYRLTMAALRDGFAIETANVDINRWNSDALTAFVETGINNVSFAMSGGEIEVSINTTSSHDGNYTLQKITEVATSIETLS